MKPGFTALGYRFCLRQIYGKVHHIAKISPWKGRLLAFPLGVGLFVTIPFEKFISLLEAFSFTLANLLAPFFPKYCSFYDAWISLKRTFIYAIGLIFSPISALLAGCAVFVSVLNNPVAASEKFAESCRN